MNLPLRFFRCQCASFPSFLLGLALLSPPGAFAKPVETTYETEMNPAYASVQIVTVADPSGKPAKPAGFNHPGVLVNRTQLDEIKRSEERR